MRLHALYIVCILVTSSSSVHCLSRTLGSNLDHQRRDDLTDDIFPNENLGFSGDESLFSEDGSSGENPNDLAPFMTNPSEEIAKGRTCAQPLGKRDVSEDDLILSEY